MKHSSPGSYLLCFVLISVAGLTTIACTNDTQEPDSTSGEADTGWTWTNPVTSKEAVFPSVWQRDGGEGTRDALLTLTHSNDKSVVYIIHEKPATSLSLDEYVKAKKESIQRELGIENIEVVNDEQKYFRGEGAKYFGDTIGGTQVKIWSHKPGGFWRAAAITDLEYKNLEYRARKLVDRLRETTL